MGGDNGDAGEDVEEYLGSDERSLPFQQMPLPKPPAGFVVDDHGRLVMASAPAKRIATIVSFFLLRKDGLGEHLKIDTKLEIFSQCSSCFNQEKGKSWL